MCVVRKPLPLLYIAHLYVIILLSPGEPCQLGNMSLARIFLPSEKECMLMKIVLINAAAPDYSRKKRYSPSTFAEESVAFAATELEEGAISEAKLDGYHIWHASSLHARQTAQMLIGTSTAISADKTSLLDEIPLAPYTDKNQELPLWKYELMGYLGWRHNSRTQPEGRVASLQRGEELLNLLESRGEDAVLISYERRILVLLYLLKKRKFQIRRGSVIRLAPMERVLATKQILTCSGCMHNCQLSNPNCTIGQDKARRYGVLHRK